MVGGWANGGRLVGWSLASEGRGSLGKHARCVHQASSQVYYRFVENAATAGASKMAMAGEMAFADARAKLRKEFRQRLSVGAWNDMFTHIFKRERFINPTPAAEAKLLGEKMARNAEFREVRAQAIKRRLDEGEALGSRAAAGRGKAEGEGIRDNVHDGRMAGSFTVAGLEAVAAAGTGGADEQRGRGERVGVGGRGTEPSDDSSSRDGRLRENNLTIAPSHPEDSQRGGSGGGDTHGSGSGSGRSEGSGASSGGDCESRSEGSGGNIGGTSSSDSSRAAGNKAKKKSKVGAGVGVTESRLDRRLERAGGNRVGPGRNGSTSGG